MEAEEELDAGGAGDDNVEAEEELNEGGGEDDVMA